MPFSIGAHPAFATPSVVDQQMQEYWLEFEQPETLDRHLIIDGLRSGETKRLLENEQTLPLHPKLFEQDAIVFKNVQSGKVSLVSRSSGKKLVEMEITGFPYLGIWQKVGADFICIEPWYGLADEHDFDGELTDKEGILLLEPEKSFHCSYTIRFL
jgi:galactose mutarotase-like enzyme